MQDIGFTVLWSEYCSSVIAPALLSALAPSVALSSPSMGSYYTPSMALCIIDIHYIRVAQKILASVCHEQVKCPKDTVHRQVKYLNNIVETDQGKLKQLFNLVRGFKPMKTAYATIKGFEVMRLFRKGQMNARIVRQGLIGEIRLIERQFEIYAI